MEGITVLVALGLMLTVGIAAAWTMRLSSKIPAVSSPEPLADVPHRRIADIGEGEIVKIVGRVELFEPPLRAPMSGRQCALFEVRVEDVSRSRAFDERWFRTASEQRATEMLVADESGRARISVGNLEARIVMDQYRVLGLFEGDPPELVTVLAKYMRHRGSGGRFAEGVLEAGARVAVLGKARWEPDPDPNAQGLRGPARRLVLTSAGPNEPLVITNDPRAF